MAVKYAIANGNWNSTAVWNGGTLPQSGDDVYLNNHTVVANVNINIGNGTIRNGANVDYNIIANGSLNVKMPRNIIANLYQESGVLITTTSTIYENGLNIVGNCKNTNYYLMDFRNVTNYHLCSPQITGNVEVNHTLINGQFGSTGYELKGLKIIGNVIINSGSLYYAYGKLFKITELNVIGNITSRNCLTYAYKLIINGNIYYTQGTGIMFTTLEVLNPDTFTWKDATEPRSNPFIIVTNAEMNNRQQYPLEEEVKEGTEYVWGEKVGTYQQPPEAVVLKDYVYDSGNKTGKLVVLPAELISRLLNCPTIETMQQLLIAHLNPETD